MKPQKLNFPKPKFKLMLSPGPVKRRPRVGKKLVFPTTKIPGSTRGLQLKMFEHKGQQLNIFEIEGEEE